MSSEKGKEMRTLSSIRSLLFLMILLVSLVTLSGCFLHHGQGPSAQTEQPAVPHEGHETATVQPVPSEASNPDQQRQHEGSGMMPMMNGSDGWHWAGMGVMMAVMVLIVL